MNKADELLNEVIAHLGAALAQSIQSDNQIIMGHVRDAHAEAKKLLVLHASRNRMAETLAYIADNDPAYLTAQISPPPKGYPGHLAGKARAALSAYEGKDNG